ncbi:universal stress protein [Leucobacter sp. PH1c]|uniref:universal stress protein n=1 Tax=Leucobacter sp. PH1c TaxID=1397278 RepID=UPI0004698001|nr:universal stress protein [Leucobacter sp. PH1c]
MTVVVGVAPGHPSAAAVHLGALLARSMDRALVLAAITPAGWTPGGGGVDGEYQRFLAGAAEDAVGRLRADCAAVLGDLDVRVVLRAASSARRGLLDVCAEERAVRLVIGAAGEEPQAGPGADPATGPGAESNADAGEGGGIALGSVGIGLLQSAELPVGIAPHGFAAAPGARLGRITAAYNGSETSGELVLGAAAVAAEAGAGLRIASFHPRPRGLLGAAIGFAAEDAVLAEWEALIRDRAGRLEGEIERRHPAAPAVELAVGAGADWRAALRAIAWEGSEVLLVGSSSVGPLARISLGSHAAKIVRCAPVPVVLVPRRAVDEYAAQGSERN